jgi:histidinol dehydrogenase
VRVERLVLDGEPRALAARIRALAPAPEGLGTQVAGIIERVRAEGDAAVLELTRRFDTPGAEPRPPRVEHNAMAGASVPPPVREALELARSNVEAVARAQLRDEPLPVALPQGHEVAVVEAPVGSAAVYVPGGRAPYPSTVVMAAATARAAGVPRVVLCSPPGRDGELDAAVLAACEVCGVDEAYRMGGAQAIAALAYGTETIAAVDVIVGPGNAYVTEAKRQVFGRVGIDGLAGPSELVVVTTDAGAAPLVALDLGAQSEHGEGSLVAAVGPDRAVLDAIEDDLPAGGDVPCVLVETAGLDEALSVADALAPEHLQLIGDDAESRAQGRTAGCVFVGPASGTAFGDYVAGSNHVLPTGGAARFASALSPHVFRRRVAHVRIAGAADRLAPAGAALARAEGFELHAASMEARMGENPPRS